MTYSPGVSTLPPGISIGSFTVRYVFLFQLSARAVGSTANSATRTVNAADCEKRMMCILLFESTPAIRAASPEPRVLRGGQTRRDMRYETLTVRQSMGTHWAPSSECAIFTHPPQVDIVSATISLQASITSAGWQGPCTTS